MQTYILQAELELLFVREEILCEFYRQTVGNEEAMKKGQDLGKMCKNNFIICTFALIKYRKQKHRKEIPYTVYPG